MGRHAVAIAKAPDVGGADIDPPKQDAITKPAPVSVLVSQYERALLPWEDAAEFRALHAAFHNEHKPQGATESSLVAQLTWIEWRRRRLMLGERSAHLASLHDRIDADYKTQQTLSRALIAQEGRAENDELADTLRRAPDRDLADVEDADDDERFTRKGIALLEAGGGYDKALAVVREDTRGWWDDILRDDLANYPDGEPDEGESYVHSRPDAASLLRFLKDDVLSMIEKTRSQATRRPAIRLQAWGESLDPFRADRIFALDERLTRQFSKTLAMLIKLREMSAPAPFA